MWNALYKPRSQSRSEGSYRAYGSISKTSSVLVWPIGVDPLYKPRSQPRSGVHYRDLTTRSCEDGKL